MRNKIILASLLSILLPNIEVSADAAPLPVAPQIDGAIVQQRQQDRQNESSFYNYIQQNDQTILQIDGMEYKVVKAKKDLYPSVSSLPIMQGVNKEIYKYIENCENQRLQGILKNYAAAAKCSNKGIISSFDDAEYPYMEIIHDFTLKRLEIAKKIDNEKITKEQGDEQIAKFIRKMNQEEKRRSISSDD
ncbi:MAG: hypothetical protein WCJ33_00255 [Pseudomonadota bacterium]